MTLAHGAYRVTLHGKHIDTVFYTRNAGEKVADAVDSVRRSLINHDGYHPDIKVTQERKK